MRLLKIVALALCLHAVAYLAFFGPVPIPYKNGVIVLAMPWQETPRLTDESGIEPLQQAVHEHLVVERDAVPLEQPDFLDATPAGTTTAPQIGIRKCRDAAGAISYVDGDCPNGTILVKQLTTHDGAGGVVSFHSYIEAERAARASQNAEQSAPRVAVLASENRESKHHPECEALLREKRHIQTLQRHRSTDHLQRRHSDVVKRLMALDCPIA